MINCCTKGITYGLKSLARSRRPLLGVKLDPKNLEYIPIKSGDLCCTEYITNRLRNIVRSRRSLVLNPEELEYAPIFKPSKYINSGTHANVYEVECYPDLVIRIRKYIKKYCPLSLKKVENKTTGVITTNNNGITVMRRLSGTPLHGTEWDTSKIPNINEFIQTMKRLSELPDSAFEKYIDDVARLKQNGYNLDVINPNNLLIDYKKGEINICDLMKGKPRISCCTLTDFYPFVDALRLPDIMAIANPKELTKIETLAKEFLDRIQEIGKRKGIELSLKNDALALLIMPKNEAMFDMNITLEEAEKLTGNNGFDCRQIF